MRFYYTIIYWASYVSDILKTVAINWNISSEISRGDWQPFARKKKK